MDIALFRASFPEFSDTARYPDGQISFWAVLAEGQVNANAWQDQTTLGVQLYVAHEITLSAQNKAAATNGANPTGIPGVVQSKAVGTVNVSYDTQQTAEKDAGWWNLTNYGRQFIRLARLFGAGGVQLGVPSGRIGWCG